MNTTEITSMSHRTSNLVRATLALVFALILVACGGGGTTVPVTRDGGLRALPSAFSDRKAVSYSPFRTGNRDTETVTIDMVKEDLNLLIAGKFGLIRLFDSSDKVSKLVLQVIKDNGLDIKVQLGAYILSESSPYISDAVKAANKSLNELEVARAVKLANDFSSIVVAVSVGNETLVSWSFVPSSPDIMAAYLTKVRSQITQPVTTDDNWAFFGDADVRVISAIDFVSLHTYTELDTVFNSTLFDWRQKAVAPADRAVAMMNASIAETKRQYGVVRSFLDARQLTAMPITIGETGWNAVDLGKLNFRAHPVNQKMYYDRLTAWSADAKLTGNGPKAIFYFEAFDEPWKGSDDKWGLFNVNREARYVIQALNPQSATWKYETPTYALTDALHWVEPVVNTAIDTNTYTTYTLYSDVAATATDLRPTGLTWNAWEGTAVGNPFFADAPVGNGPNSFEVSPNPYGGWGWGMFLGAGADTAANLSRFAASGHLHFSVKTNGYPGKIEVGFLTNTADNETAESYLAIGVGQYGYSNDNTWHDVSIPLKDIIGATKGDLSMVMHRFVIADRFANTDKAPFTTGLPKIYIDKIYYSKD